MSVKCTPIHTYSMHITWHIYTHPDVHTYSVYYKCNLHHLLLQCTIIYVITCCNGFCYNVQSIMYITHCTWFLLQCKSYMYITYCTWLLFLHTDCVTYYDILSTAVHVYCTACSHVPLPWHAASRLCGRCPPGAWVLQARHVYLMADDLFWKDEKKT